jgi:D-aminopeptidase
MPKPLDLLRLSRRIDHLIEPWNGPKTPGCTIGVVMEGALVLHRSAGMASVELGQPIGPETCFRVASVTKQFTCAAILLLAAEGRLSLDADMRELLPDLPDFGARVSVAHLLHNCSGIRDFLELMRLGGMDLNQPCEPADLLAVIGRQGALNFAPGTRFLYSNTNFLLLGLIVEKIEGEPLREVLERRILLPLGMTRSLLTDQTAEVVSGLANGYFPREGGGFLRAAHAYPLGGEGGLVSCVEDLALWDRNFSTGTVGGLALGRALAEQLPFLNGRTNTYARGLDVKDYRGLRTMGHGGLWPGFRTEFLRVPERGMTVICIANLATIDPYRLARKVVDAAVEGVAGVHPVLLPARHPADAGAALAGRWLDPAAPATLEIEVATDGAVTATTNGMPFPLFAGADGRLVADRGAFAFAARPDPSGGTLDIEWDAGAVASYRRAAGGGVLPADLPGHYVSEELGATWDVAARPDGGMAVRVAGPLRKAGPWALEAIEGDLFRLHTPATLFRAWQDIRTERDAAGAITGLTVNGGRVRGIRFVRAGVADSLG